MLVYKFVFCVVFLGFAEATSSEEEAEVKEICWAHIEEMASKLTTLAACEGQEPPDSVDYLPGQEEICRDTMRACCQEQFREKDFCADGIKLAASKQCSTPISNIGKRCCEECSFGTITGETGSKEFCGAPPDGDGIGLASFLTKTAFYKCCTKAEEKPETTTKKAATTTTTPKPKVACKRDSCAHICDDSDGVVRCSCREGFRLQPDKKTCNDINECLEAQDDLCIAEDTVCHNVPGAFKCVPIKKRDVGLGCPPGFKRNVQNQVCDDINECQLPRPPCPKYLCENTIGGYKCSGKPGKPFEELVPGGSAPRPTQPPSPDEDTPKNDICPPGFRTGADDECDDIDECKEISDDCQRLSQHCINTHGGFFCQDHVSKRCAPGFKVNTATGVCEDIDECEESNEVCRRNEVCVNLPGAYNCKSKISQLPKLATKNCQEGTRLKPGGKTCEDIDECREGSHLCDQFQNCINTFGAHECRCKNGFELDTTSGSCEDVDECALKLDNCAPGLSCLNVLGSFTCTRQPPTSPRQSTTTTPAPVYDYEYYYSDEDNSTDNEVLQTTPKSTTPRPTTPRLTSPPPTNPPPTTSQPTTTSTARPRPTYPPTTTPKPTRRPYTPYRPDNRRPSLPYRPTTPDERVTTPENKPESLTPSPDRVPYFPPSPPEDRRPDSPPARPTPDAPENPRPEDRPATRPAYRPYRPNRPEDPIDNEPRRPEDRTPDRRPVYPYAPIRPEDPLNNEPIRPTEPTRPTYPTRPTNPTRPTDPTDPSSPTDPTEPSRPRRPAYPRRPGYSGKPDPPGRQPGRKPFRRPTTTTEIPTTTAVAPGFNPSDVHCLYGFEKDENGNCVEAGMRSTPPAGSGYDANEMHCLNGFEKDRYGNCADVNECDKGQHTCSSLEMCVNKIGGYTCECIPGFRRADDGWCVVVSSSTSTSTSTTTSTSTQRPYVNRAPSTPEWNYGPYPRPAPREPYPVAHHGVCNDLGYKFDLVQGKCVDIDECLEKKHTCHNVEECVNMDGGFECVCGPQCRAEKDRPVGNRLPVEPAPRQPADPASNVITVGSQYGQRGPWSPRPSHAYTNDGNVVRSCPWGYKLTPDKRCYDVDECTNNASSCGPQQRCENFYGGYSCQCPAGHKLVEQHGCEDIDECVHGTPCSYNSQCINTIGSYRCECSSGFRNAISNDKVCVDMDECTETPNVCEQHCSNAWGGYRCSCNRGFRLGSDNRTCDDVNECEEWSAMRNSRAKLCGGDCINVHGSYKCGCPPGYRLSDDQRSCIDINECETGEATCASSSDPSQVCQNTRGSYHCHRIDCPEGYRLEAKHRCARIQRSCETSDWACLQQPGSYSYNFITFVANIYIPFGSVDLFTMHGPAWSDSVVSFEMRMVRVQASPGVKPADLRCFDMRPSNNVCVISLLCSLEGPQVAELELSMSLYQRGMFAGRTVARLVVIVSQYEY